jgi:outer membrane protein, heavy metal efflux system
VAAREAVGAARARERQAGAYPNPTLAYSREQASGRGQTSSQNIAVLEQPIELGGLRTARRDAARFHREAAEARVAVAEAQLDFEVTRAYALAVAAGRRAVLADEAARAFDHSVQVSERRLAAGDISRYTDRRLRLEAARCATIRAEATLAQRSTRLALGALIAPHADSIATVALVLSDTLVAPSVLPVSDSLRTLAQRARGEVVAAELESRAAAAAARLASHERLPVPVLSGGIKTERTSSPSGGDLALNGLAAGISIPLPLWDRRAGAVEAATAEARRRSAEIIALRRRVAREVAEAYDAVRAAQVQVEALAPQLGAESRAALRSAQIAYEEGDIPLVEWLDAVRAYQEAEAGFATLRADLLVRRAALERAAGVPLSTFSFTGGAVAPKE